MAVLLFCSQTKRKVVQQVIVLVNDMERAKLGFPFQNRLYIEPIHILTMRAQD